MVEHGADYEPAKDTHSSLSHVSYGVSAASVLQKTYCVLTL